MNFNATVVGVAAALAGSLGPAFGGVADIDTVLPLMDDGASAVADAGAGRDDSPAAPQTRATKSTTGPVPPEYRTLVSTMIAEGNLQRPSTQFMFLANLVAITDSAFGVPDVHEDVQYIGGSVAFPIWGRGDSRPAIEGEVSYHQIDSTFRSAAATVSAGADGLAILFPTGFGFGLPAGFSDLSNVAYRSNLRDQRVSVGLKTYIGLDGSNTSMGAPGGYFAPHVGLHVGQRDVDETFSGTTAVGTLGLASLSMLSTDSVGLSLGGYVFSPDIAIPGLKLYGGGRVDASLDKTDGFTQLDLTGGVVLTDRRDLSKTDVSVNYELGAGVQYNSRNFSLDLGYRYLNMEVPDIEFDLGAGLTGARLGSQRSEANLFSLEATYRFR